MVLDIVYGNVGRAHATFAESGVSDGICVPCVRLRFVSTKLIVPTRAEIKKKEGSCKGYKLVSAYSTCLGEQAVAVIAVLIIAASVYLPRELPLFH